MSAGPSTSTPNEAAKARPHPSFPENLFSRIARSTQRLQRLCDQARPASNAIADAWLEITKLPCAEFSTQCRKGHKPTADETAVVAPVRSDAAPLHTRLFRDAPAPAQAGSLSTVCTPAETALCHRRRLFDDTSVNTSAQTTDGVNSSDPSELPESIPGMASSL